MNQARDLYLGTYSRINFIDNLVKDCHLKYQSWKYWHSPMLHATVLAIVIAYGMYLEVAEGKLDGDLKIESPVDFWTFQDVLSVQMFEYDPKNWQYLGDDAMRVCTKQRFQERGSPTLTKQYLVILVTLNFGEHCSKGFFKNWKVTNWQTRKNATRIWTVHSFLSNTTVHATRED